MGKKYDSMTDNKMNKEIRVKVLPILANNNTNVFLIGK